MNIWENITNALSTILANKLRSGLTMLGIIIGVSSVVVMISIGNAAQQNVTARLQQMGTNLLMITPGSSTQTNVRSAGGGNSSSSFSNDDYAVIQKISGLQGVSAEYSSRKQVIYGANNSNISITGVVPEYQIVRNFKVQYGQFITDKNQENAERIAVVGSDVVTNLFEGKNPIGKDIRIENNIFTVVGVMETKGSGSGGMSSQDNVVFIPLSTAQGHLFGTQKLSSINVSVVDATQMDNIKTEIEHALREAHKIIDPTNDDFTVLNQADALSTLNDVTGIFTVLLGGIAGISLLVGGIGVMNIMLVSVTERTREIGIRKAIGAKKSDILFQFLTESVFLSILGGAIGILLSFGGAYLIASLVNSLSTVSVSTSAIIMAFLFSSAVGVFFGIVPAWKAANLKPIDALRFE